MGCKAELKGRQKNKIWKDSLEEISEDIWRKKWQTQEVTSQG